VTTTLNSTGSPARGAGVVTESSALSGWFSGGWGSQWNGPQRASLVSRHVRAVVVVVGGAVVVGELAVEVVVGAVVGELAVEVGVGRIPARGAAEVAGTVEAGVAGAVVAAGPAGASVVGDVVIGSVPATGAF